MSGIGLVEWKLNQSVDLQFIPSVKVTSTVDTLKGNYYDGIKNEWIKQEFTLGKKSLMIYIT